MTGPRSEVISHAERELADVNRLVDEQFGIVTRLKRLDADIAEAVHLLIDLPEFAASIRANTVVNAAVHRKSSATALWRAELSSAAWPDGVQPCGANDNTQSLSFLMIVFFSSL